MALTAGLQTLAQPGDRSDCRVLREGTRVELHSPYFVFRLDTTSGLRAQSWENRLTDHTLSLGNGPELEFDLGLPDDPLQTPRLEVSKVELKGQGQTGEARLLADRQRAGRDCRGDVSLGRQAAGAPQIRDIMNTGRPARGTAC